MRRHSGFTLIELMVVLAIIAIMATIGIPSYQNMIRDNRLTSATNTLLSALQYARSEAVTQRADITVTPLSNNNWATGALIKKGTVKLRETPPAGTDITVTGSAAAVTYGANGTTSATTFTLQDSRSSSREIKINAIGQACAGSHCS